MEKDVNLHFSSYVGLFIIWVNVLLLYFTHFRQTLSLTFKMVSVSHISPAHDLVRDGVIVPLW